MRLINLFWDEKNTDVAAEKANAPADAATPATEEEAPKAQ